MLRWVEEDDQAEKRIRNGGKGVSDTPPARLREKNTKHNNAMMVIGRSQKKPTHEHLNKKEQDVLLPLTNDPSFFPALAPSPPPQQKPKLYCILFTTTLSKR